MALGSILGGGSRGRQTVTHRTHIPQFMRPLMEQQAGAAGSALGNLQSRLGGAGAGDMVAPFSGDQLAAFDFARSQMAPGGAFPQAMDTLGQTAGGAHLFGGQGFDQAVDAAVRQAQPHILSRFGAAGRGTGGLAQHALGQSAIDAFAGLHNQERQRQLQAASALPGIAGQGFGLLSGIGGMQQQQAQRELMAPIQAQQMLMQASGGPVPMGGLFGQNTQATGPSGSPLAGGLTAGLGGALTGAQLGSVVPGFGTGVGAIGGGAIGLLGGLFS